jgi:hypothetical protein
MNMIKAQIQELYLERQEALKGVDHWILHSTPDNGAAYYRIFDEQRQLHESIRVLKEILAEIGG